VRKEALAQASGCGSEQARAQAERRSGAAQAQRERAAVAGAGASGRWRGGAGCGWPERATGAKGRGGRRWCGAAAIGAGAGERLAGAGASGLGPRELVAGGAGAGEAAGRWCGRSGPTAWSRCRSWTGACTGAGAARPGPTGPAAAWEGSSCAGLECAGGAPARQFGVD
jgi:hypothetical protein